MTSTIAMSAQPNETFEEIDLEAQLLLSVAEDIDEYAGYGGINAVPVAERLTGQKRKRDNPLSPEDTLSCEEEGDTQDLKYAQTIMNILMRTPRYFQKT